MRNQLLSRLPAPILKKLLPHFDNRELEQGQLVYAADSLIESLFFPEDCVLSAVTNTSDGRQIEVGTIGNEGVTGLTSFMRPTTSPHEVLAQISGQAIASERKQYVKLSKPARRPGLDVSAP